MKYSSFFQFVSATVVRTELQVVGGSEHFTSIGSTMMSERIYNYVVEALF